jgi:DNA replicative helicase MCM subunit Mcm2 (Cdc46/Mcm family)
MATGNDAGRVPRTIECELTDDLVDAGVPGDVVTVSGVVKVLNPDLEKPGTLFLYVDTIPFLGFNIYFILLYC